ncbi:hypothetical protein ZPAH1_orf00370 [Aeromonas phage ZPAH1]|nr:hypothetical protein ASwh1_325 [Aeromonas phage Aswh_1]QQG34132.1 hypothetical protein ZPAH1_orf00370 [Aeromonas phage ZPAH1]
MQYVLSEEEYKELKAKQEYGIALSKSKLQKLCTKIANTMPVFYWGNKEAQIWGCVLNEEIPDDQWEEVETPGKEVMYTSGYCDQCPVQEICPAPKRWSK